MNDPLPASGTDREIFGKLGSVSLNDIIQLLGMSRRTATLELRRGEERGRIFFRDGQIVHAIAGPYEGEESFIELLGWGDADFAVEEGIDSLPKVSITKSTEALLLSTMTALDEVGRITAEPALRVGPTIPRRRLPPRPRPRPSRPRTRLRLALLALAATVGWLALPAIWPADAPWQSLPSAATPRGTSRAALTVPDAWSVAEAVWQEPAPVAPPPTPATPPATVVEPAYLTIVVEPWARVEIDGALVGETPLGKIELAPGAHRITLANDHVVGVIRDELAVEPGDELTKRYSFANTGYLSLVAAPWANVSVDGRPIGQTPLAKLAVPAGDHSVRFVHPALGTTERTVTVVSGRTTLVKVELP